MIDRLQELLEEKKKTEAKLGKVLERRRIEKGNEDAWPGHGTAGDMEDEVQEMVLLNHLAEIEKELKKLNPPQREGLQR